MIDYYSTFKQLLIAEKLIEGSGSPDSIEIISRARDDSKFLRQIISAIIHTRFCMVVERYVSTDTSFDNFYSQNNLGKISRLTEFGFLLPMRESPKIVSQIKMAIISLVVFANIAFYVSFFRLTMIPTDIFMLVIQITLFIIIPYLLISSLFGRYLDKLIYKDVSTVDDFLGKLTLLNMFIYLDNDYKEIVSYVEEFKQASTSSVGQKN